MATLRIRCTPPVGDDLRVADSSDVRVSVVMPDGEEFDISTRVASVSWKCAQGEAATACVRFFDADIDIEAVALKTEVA